MNSVSFSQTLRNQGLGPLTRAAPSWLQVNLGKRCNQACAHCHVDASPRRTEMMSGATVDQVLHVLAQNPSLQLLDITGGAPELNPHFRRLVAGAYGLGREIMDRCNLTILSEPGQEDTADFLAAHGVHVVASLPCYLESNVDKQRGRGVFERSIAGLRQLNALGYGEQLKLDLVYNPVGAHLPPNQASLEDDYRRRLAEEHGVRFTNLLTLANMPIARFAADLSRQGKAEAYMELLVQAFNPATVQGLMCRHLISVSWEGLLYDCDFNQMLDLPVPGEARHLRDIADLASWEGAPIAVGAHCFGCTAGAGSSCGGALA
ncbi:MAG: arsenosugar biosynthesis radical SAM protein ArsS [Alphaproteobacteria bacterium]|nr:arsenosugar biosynthesis radical SAM protein ArsS [Alphaproteobacteria bacterium]MCB9797974.1 arsenosugar biosynthesis radical SAM protein ArsS [Alphaproteobacteria bacterium]